MKKNLAMSDETILELYFRRDESAIEKTREKFGSYIKMISKNILGNEEDTEECVYDTYLRAWNSIPPKRPENLATYLGKIVRNLSLDRYRRNNAEKRGSGGAEAILDELSECVSGNSDVESEMYRKELAQAINDFLDTLTDEHSKLFVCRYWYAMPVQEIAKRFRMREGNVSVTLNRIRKKLRTFLLERGFDA